MQKLSIDTTIEPIIKTWYSNLRSAFPLRQYLQLYGYVNASSYQFRGIPAAYATQVLLEFTPVAFEASMREIGWLVIPNRTRVDVWILLIGGSDWKN